MQGLGPIIVVHGGASEDERRNDLWQYDTYQNIWTEAFPDDNGGIERRELHQMVDVNGKMMIHGGAADLGVDGVQRYVVSDVWEFLPCICMAVSPTARNAPVVRSIATMEGASTTTLSL